MRKVEASIGNARFICATSLVLIFCARNFVFSELIPIQSCTIKPSNSCEILNITIDPCPEANDGQTCNYYRGKNTTMTMYYIPKFNATKMTVQRYSVVLFVDIPDPTYFDREFCAYNTPSCPITAGQTYKFQQRIPILETYPVGVYTAKWKIWNENDEECCFSTQAAIV